MAAIMKKIDGIMTSMNRQGDNDTDENSPSTPIREGIVQQQHQQEEQGEREVQEGHEEQNEKEEQKEGTVGRLRRRLSLEWDCINTKMTFAEQATTIGELQHKLDKSQSENKCLSDVISYLRTKLLKEEEHRENNAELYEVRRELLEQKNVNNKLSSELKFAQAKRDTYQVQVSKISEKCDALLEEYHLSLDVIFQLRERVECLAAERDGLRTMLNMDAVKEEPVAIPTADKWFSCIHGHCNDAKKKDNDNCGDDDEKMNNFHFDQSMLGRNTDDFDIQDEGNVSHDPPVKIVMTKVTDDEHATTTTEPSSYAPEKRRFFMLPRSSTVSTSDNSTIATAAAAAVDSSAAASTRSGWFTRKSPTTDSDEITVDSVECNSADRPPLFAGFFQRVMKGEEPSTSDEQIAAHSDEMQRSCHDNGIWKKASKNMTWNSKNRFDDDSNQQTPIRRCSVFETGLPGNSLTPSSSIMDDYKKMFARSA
mmetsp:Transcript_5219/g.6953  ORF Transcript_5219/g.6953 Transcript_5219/m.6953 type:complete len:480 (-) Transcript_5219:113-1552(-)